MTLTRQAPSPAAEAQQAISYAIQVLDAVVRDRSLAGDRRDAVTYAIAGLKRVLRRIEAGSSPQVSAGSVS